MILALFQVLRDVAHPGLLQPKQARDGKYVCDIYDVDVSSVSPNVQQPGNVDIQHEGECNSAQSDQDGGDAVPRDFASIICWLWRFCHLRVNHPEY